MTRALLTAFIFASFVGHALAGAGGAPQGTGARDRVLATAVGLLGTTEATGHNDGPAVERILASTGNRRGEPYCAAFNFYCYQQAGLASLAPRSAWSPDWVRSPTWTRAEGGRTPQPADSFGIYFSSKGRVAHTGLVRAWAPRVVVTVEANTSPDAAPGSAADRDGGGIWSKRRLTSQIYAVRDWITR
jgi:hypothetical protein